MILILILLAAVVAANAILDAKMILQNKAINHTLEYVIFFVLSFVIVWLVSLLSGFNWNIGKIFLISFAISTLARIAFFNIINYYERGLKLDYESTQTTSIIDKVEHKLWKIILERFKIRIKDVFVSIAALLAYIIIIISFL